MTRGRRQGTNRNNGISLSNWYDRGKEIFVLDFQLDWIGMRYSGTAQEPPSILHQQKNKDWCEQLVSTRNSLETSNCFRQKWVILCKKGASILGRIFYYSSVPEATNILRFKYAPLILVDIESLFSAYDLSLSKKNTLSPKFGRQCLPATVFKICPCPYSSTVKLLVLQTSALDEGSWEEIYFILMSERL